MCYWRRLSKRSVDNSDYDSTDESYSNSSSSGHDNAYANFTQEPVISDSLSLFKALQVRHEPIEPARARQRAQQLQEIYAEDDDAQLVCYRHAEVMVFLATMGSLLLLVLSVAVTCCLRIRKLTTRGQLGYLNKQSGQFQHKRLHLHPGQSGSPSLLSIGSADHGTTLTTSSSACSLMSFEGLIGSAAAPPTTTTSAAAQTLQLSPKQSTANGKQFCLIGGQQGHNQRQHHNHSPAFRVYATGDR